MSKVTYFTARQTVLQVLNTKAPVGFTSVDCSLFVPAGATALIVMTELEAQVLPAVGEYAASQKQKDAAQGVCSQDTLPYSAAPVIRVGDNAIIPLTAARAFEYNLTGIGALGTLTVNLRVYAIGYIS